MTQPKAILFGAIGTLVETSELQRQAFNSAFAREGLDWSWGRMEYAELLQRPGGLRRIQDYAARRGKKVDAERIYRAKVAYFRESVQAGLELRPGVADVIRQAQDRGVALGFATTTGSDTVDLIFDGLRGTLDRNVFAFIGDRDFVSRSKPSPEIYRLALAHFGLAAGDAVAIEDTPESAEAALAAHIPCTGFPGEVARGRAFPTGIAHVVDRLQPGLLGLRGAVA